MLRAIMAVFLAAAVTTTAFGGSPGRGTAAASKGSDQQPAPRLCIDRVENGGVVILLTADGQQIEFPEDYLPADAKPGDLVYFAKTETSDYPFIDRVEDETFAVVIVDEAYSQIFTDGAIAIDVKYLYPHAHEGDSLVLKKDQAATDQLKQETREVQDELKQRDDGGDVIL